VQDRLSRCLLNFSISLTPRLNNRTSSSFDVATLHEAERMIESCEHCNPEGAEIPFDVILDRVTNSDTSVTDYVLEEPARCPNCRREIVEKSLVEPVTTALRRRSAIRCICSGCRLSLSHGHQWEIQIRVERVIAFGTTEPWPHSWFSAIFAFVEFGLLVIHIFDCAC
jgi:hypothetical protein